MKAARGWIARAVACMWLSVTAATGDEPNLWSLTPVVRPEVPAGSTASSNPIDAFIAAEYQAKGLTPVGPADKRTLLRRVYLDLIGLPPTPAEQEAFLKRRVAGRLREGGRPAAGQRAARRPLRPPLARCAALRRRRRADDRRARAFTSGATG